MDAQGQRLIDINSNELMDKFFVIKDSEGIALTAVAVCDLYSAPIINAKPVMPAQWIWRGKDKGFECSNCHSRCLLNYESDWCSSTHCPHCGAEMKLAPAP